MLKINTGHFLTKISALPLFILISCAPQSRPLLARGLPESEREFYVVQNGFFMPWVQRQAFLGGQILPGMSKEMIFQLIGAPDRTFKKDSIWEYIDNRGTTILELVFDNKKDTVLSLTGNVN